MLISPVQTRSIVFRQVSVAPALEESGRVKASLKAAGFVWDGVNFAIETGVGTREDQVENPVDFIISLRLTVRNDDGKECPYLFDLEAVALIQLAQSVPAEKREELAEVNGLAITYGAMREMLVGLTSRMEYGALVLPGVNFQDHVKGGTPDGAGRQLTKKAPSTKRLPSAEPASPPGSPTV